MSRANPRFRRQNLKLPTPVNNVYRVKFLGSIENQLTINTFYYRDANALGTANLTHYTNLYNAITSAGALRSAYVGCISSDWTMTEIIIDCPTSPSLSEFYSPDSTAGGGPGLHLPTENAMVFDRYTGNKGQCGRGRVSLPAIPGSWVTQSKVTTITPQTLLRTAMTTALTSGADTFTPGLYSRNGSHAFPGAGYADLTSVFFNPLIGTVRRRKIGRGK